MTSAPEMLLVKVINLSQKPSFSSLLLPLCGAYADIILNNLAPIINLIAIIRSFTLLTSILLSIHFLATNIHTHTSVPLLIPLPVKFISGFHATYRASSKILPPGLLYATYIYPPSMNNFHHFSRFSCHTANIPSRHSYVLLHICHPFY